MKKQLLTLALVLVGLMSSMQLRADKENPFYGYEELYNYVYIRIEDSNIEKYRRINDMQYDAQSRIFSFKDNWKVGTVANRYYSIAAYPIEEDKFCQLGLYKVPCYYAPLPYISDLSFYQDWDEAEPLDTLDYYKYDRSVRGITGKISRNNDTDGKEVVKVLFPDLLTKSLQKGLKKVRIFIEPTIEHLGQETSYYVLDGYNESEIWEMWGSTYDNRSYYLSNYVDIDIPEYVIGPVTTNRTEVRYGAEKITYNVHVQSSYALTYHWERLTNGEWRAIKTLGLSAEEARNGQNLSLDITNFPIGLRDLRIRLRIDADQFGTVYSNEVSLPIYYPVNGQGLAAGNWYQAGEKVDRAVLNYDCLAADFKSEKKVETYPTKSGNTEYIGMVMPAAPVEIVLYEPTYTVRFWDGQSNLLKEEKVKCGGAATAPTAPARTGYTFKGWDKDFSNVHRDLSVSAQYDYDAFKSYAKLIKHGSKSELFRQRDCAYLNANDTLTMRLSVTSDKAASFYMQYKRDDEGWKTSSSATNFTQAEAEDGTIKDVTVVPFRSSDDDYAKISVRYKVVSGSMESYTPAYTFILCYDVQYYPYEEIEIRNSLLHDTIAIGNDWVKIPIPVGDTLFVNRLDSLNGCSVLRAPNMTDDGKTDDGKMWCVANASRSQSFDILGERTYQVSFHLNGGTISDDKLALQTIGCGDKVQDPGVPTREGYRFTGWDMDYESLYYKTEGYTYVINAQWEEIVEAAIHNVIFKGISVTLSEEYEETVTPIVLKEEQVKHYENAVPPTDTKVSGYLFMGWDKEYYNIVEDMTITAQYEKIPSSSSSEGIRDILAEHDVPTQKILVNGKFYIISAGRIYDAQGRLVE